MKDAKDAQQEINLIVNRAELKGEGKTRIILPYVNENTSTVHGPTYIIEEHRYLSTRSSWGTFALPQRCTDLT